MKKLVGGILAFALISELIAVFSYGGWIRWVLVAAILFTCGLLNLIRDGSFWGQGTLTKARDGQQLRFGGLRWIVLYRGKPEIVVNDPSQIAPKQSRQENESTRVLAADPDADWLPVEGWQGSKLTPALYGDWFPYRDWLSDAQKNEDQNGEHASEYKRVEYAEQGIHPVTVNLLELLFPDIVPSYR